MEKDYDKKFMRLAMTEAEEGYERGDFREESYSLLVNHMRKNKSWERILKSFEKMHDS